MGEGARGVTSQPARGRDGRPLGHRGRGAAARRLGRTARALPCAVSWPLGCAARRPDARRPPGGQLHQAPADSSPARNAGGRMAGRQRQQASRQTGSGSLPTVDEDMID
ncbi:hypothetical protein PAHAL_4G202300 [Panicum hallii]|uniref:Uncharacterized protein n=1 Tax=Panicum hallii TaxID=206008 RepID=A0A2T8JDH0_9POAL|nr:hypothetical protein PAHAL_4G202300 [Panicum hallii]PVH47967.1 hypothetical protein PAHAL_4G202300 [Panicum hallii]